MPDAARVGLGEFLRSRRERLSPAALGLPDRRRRRTPGLRREEVAELAGIGVDWYIRLEQGRTVSPSPATVEALARALRLDDAERAHLRALARNPARTPFTREKVPEATRRLVESLAEPAYVTGRRWDVLVWNRAAAELLADFGAVPEEDRNVLVQILLGERARRLFGDGWAAQARHAVAQFRAAHDLWAGDPAFTGLAARLRAGCPEFATWWERHDVVHSGPGRKTLYRPEPQSFDYATFQVNEDPALRLTIYAPTSGR
ncbi:helix-turn-helix transcriptional regulator [Amycolatopsis australiensis]|uniref:Helix-turn-helix domain-containing protein n=1 Tax=Amycolatopsis australiensis TaxID=546364 RepID=A0A1K1SMM1_9PSEU|nr:helix-turn-helix transcriptional regulator [Amycolatopsis australiensis]SFW85117.1 Helix-turn-helix domain-containing protein [Amycolatopsis australiensis]